MLDYNQALDFIHGLSVFGSKLGLNNIRKLLHLLDNPQKDIKTIHVAGTNGKGSTCAMIDSILRSANFCVGLYTSPYIEIFNERIQVNGKNISNSDLARLTTKVREKVLFMRENKLGFPTEFEVITAIGFCYFKEKSVDFLVLEVGMGGRLDATNVVTPVVSVITPVSLDHQQYLGDNLADITREKCGIIKSGIPVVTGPQEPDAMEIIRKTCGFKRCSLTEVGNTKVGLSHNIISHELITNNINNMIFNVRTSENNYSNLKISLLGVHQSDNAATAIGAIEQLGIDDSEIKRNAIYLGLEKTKWPARLEIISENPTILIDGAHNIAGIKTLKLALSQYFAHKKKILVLGILKDKDYKQILKEIVPGSDTIIFTEPLSQRALSSDLLVKEILNICSDSILLMQDKNHGTGKKTDDQKSIKVYSKKNIEDAIRLAFSLAAANDLIIFAGSLYLVGHVRTLLNDATFKKAFPFTPGKVL